MIQDLDKSLQTLLARELAPEVAAVDIRFEAPDGDFVPGAPTINCFLYDVSENLELRSNEWIQERLTDGNATQTRSPIRLDCSYLITAWAGDMETEHRILGNLVRVFAKYKTIPDEVLQQSLQDRRASLPEIGLQSGELDDLAAFWQALGAKPKPGLVCKATISIEIHEPEAVVPVRERIIDLRVNGEFTS